MIVLGGGGEIPPEIGNLTNLIYLNAANNELSGFIPSEIGTFMSMCMLRLQDNQLSGDIPESICDLNITWSDSAKFNLSNNKFCPPYPSCIEEYMGDQDTSNCEAVMRISQTVPIVFNLHNAYANPFNSITSLRYDLSKDELVNIIIYDMMGRIVKTLVNKSQTAGYKSIQWNATNDRNKRISAGLYMYTIQIGEFRQTRKIVLLK